MIMNTEMNIYVNNGEKEDNLERKESWTKLINFNLYTSENINFNLMLYDTHLTSIVFTWILVYLIVSQINLFRIFFFKVI
jgi:hypothetical protein